MVMIKHGTVAGYKKENRMVNAGELDKVCPECKEAWAAYYRAYQADKKAMRYLVYAFDNGGWEALTPWQQAWLFGYADANARLSTAVRAMVDGDHTLVEEIIHGD